MTSSIDEPEIDGLLDAARTTWQTAIARDERSRSASEARLRTTVPRAVSAPRPLLVAFAVLAVGLAVVAARHSPRPAEIRAEATRAPSALPTMEPTSDPPVVAPAAPTASQGRVERPTASTLPPLPAPSVHPAGSGRAGPHAPRTGGRFKRLPWGDTNL